MEKRRVVVTGVGCVSPYGIGADIAWNSVIEGKSGISKLENVDESQTVKIGGQIPEFDTSLYINPKEVKRYDKYITYALIAAKEAKKDADFDIENEANPFLTGVVIGTGQGGTETMFNAYDVCKQRGFTKCSPFTVPMMIPNMAAGIVSIMLGAKGFNKSVSSACATGAHAIGDAYRAIQYGDADVVFAGGSERSLTNFTIGAFTSARTLAQRNDEPEKASRPYDKDRNGFVMAEGATILVLEELEHAKKRGAKVLAELVGYGQGGDAYDIVAPDPSGAGAEGTVKMALKDAGVSASDIDYINMHGTSTHLGDIAESKMVERVFGSKDVNKNLLVSSTKSMTGHLLGNAGSIEAFFTLKTVMEDKVPPTINLDNLDEEVGNLDYVPNKYREHKVNYAMSNSFGFGGSNAVLIFKKYEEK